ncbi:uncharacterized protein with ParB-like and HNH nuclease domain/predicted transport protein [Deinococcus metalli]|uniref:Uncharacterized protein with ParB-like and HNH nuclease domain/predicted transport protein n=1 Tax=Deinococcus metalli TaxID=1141878 RepID=A0A7W8KIZ2_9DEIO|nr:DUF262 and DUF1524 domain-containing protein [Deinococcus metalli]MBB5379074.1 uncharacterized protein with ParB-like and HNH nuclease domain/predicted transport protein [Deinococcus metalli]GHF64054.1 hypothetical protein GCM10017781_45000 [Deinococcus metalli]
MIAEQAKLAELLEGTKQFEVPLYQRPYSWGTPEREQFWRDILRAGRDPKPGMHFTGSVVFMERTGSMAGNLKRARLIDGQQRLTTLTLLMLALSEQLAQVGELELPLEGTSDTQVVDAADIRNDYLVNKNLTGDSRYKLSPTHVDRDTLRHLIGNGPLPPKVSREIQAGADFFRQRLSQPGVNLKEVLRGVNKLQVVTVALEEGRDDPQLIFESLNSTGKDLTQADLIRNNVLMGLPSAEQDMLSRDYWVKLEEGFADTEEGTFDRFMRDFLTLRTRGLPNEQEVYAAFKAYRSSRPADEGVETLVRDVAHLGKLYMGIIDPTRMGNADVQVAMEDLMALRLRIISPFVLELLQDHEQGLLTDDDLVGSLRALEAFLLRRAVVGERTSPLNRFFAGLGRDLNKQDYLRSLLRALVRFQDRDQDGFPGNEPFARALREAALYRLNVCKPLLVRLERSMNPKEKFQSANLTIEHVMPQNEDLSQEWRDMLGTAWPEVQGRLVHMLGNLTLTGYNSELGDRPFSEKKTLPEPKGYEHSRLLMTRKIAALPAWTESVIVNRASELIERALELWPFPAFSPEEVAALRAEGRQRGKVRTVDDHLQTSSPALRTLFAQVRERLLALDDRVVEMPQKHYVAYKVGTNFCDIVPQPALDTVKCWLNLPPADLDDPLHMTRDITGKGKPGNGNVELTLSAQSDLDAFTALADQALEYQLWRNEKASTPAGQGKVGKEVDFSQLPPEVLAVFQALETRTTGLSSDIQAHSTQFYRAFRARRVFMEVKPRTGSINVAVKIPPAALEPDAFEGWVTSGQWLARPVRSMEELERAWPGIVAAFTRQQDGDSDDADALPPAVSHQQYKLAKTIYAQLASKTAELSDDIEVVTTQKSVKFFAPSGEGAREFMRLYSSARSGHAGVRLNVLPAALDNPDSVGQMVDPGNETTGFTDGHFEYRVTTLEGVEAVLPLIQQAYEIVRA